MATAGGGGDNTHYDTHPLHGYAAEQLADDATVFPPPELFENYSIRPEFIRDAASVDQDDAQNFEQVISIVVPVFFSFIAVLGFVGNLMVIMVVVSNRQMRNTTNVLIINLAVADLLFIVICVPFTAVAYAIPVWPFGSIWCKIYQYAIHVTAYISVYTLVLMSLDRYLAVVHPITSMTLRCQRNTIIAITVMSGLILVLNAPTIPDFDILQFDFLDETRSACVNVRIATDSSNHDYLSGRVFYGCFFAFAYALPLSLVCALYGFMLRRLLYGMPRAGGGGGTSRQSAESMRCKRRVTRLCVVVVLIFALCWLPMQVTFLRQYFWDTAETELQTSHVIINITSNCLVYMNSCVNPILYAFLSETFRKSFKRLLCRTAADRFRPLPIEASRWVRRGEDGGREATAGGEGGEANEGVILLDGSQTTAITTA